MYSTTTSDLPVEILRHIFHLLPPKDLKSAALVCKLWEEMLEGEPKLWTWAVVTIDTVSDLEKLKVPRLGLIKTIRFKRQSEHLEEIFRGLLAFPIIKKIF